MKNNKIQIQYFSISQKNNIFKKSNYIIIGRRIQSVNNSSKSSLN